MSSTLGAPLTPGQRAQVDQVLALINEVDKAWPWNEHLMANSEVERVVLERAEQGWQGMRSDRAYLLWGNGQLVELDHALTEHDICRQVVRAAPPGVQQCDTCPVVTTPAGVAVVNMRRNLVPLLLCPTCASELNPDVLIETGASHA